MATAEIPRRHVSVLGAGSWGTALATLACARNDTMLWARNTSVAASINTTHTNPAYLTDIVLPTNLRCTADFQATVDHVCTTGDVAGLIILGVPVAGLAQVCADLSQAFQARSDKAQADNTRAAAGDNHVFPAVVWTCKGFDQESGLLAHQIAQQAFSRGPAPSGMGVLSGPSFAQEVAQGLPVALTIASTQPFVVDVVTAVLHGANARIYASDDIIGVEAGGALKNVMAIACGIADGLELGTNARAALITRGLAEMQRLGVALGGRAETFTGLTGLGDLVLTATGPLSRNRQAGLTIGQGKDPTEIFRSGVTVEGVRCARAVLELGRQHRVELPITQAVCQVLFQGMSPREAVSQLLGRQARAESPS